MKLSKKTIVWILVVLLSIPFLLSGLMKIFSTQDIVRAAEAWSISSNKLFLLGFIELVCIIFFIIQRTGVLGSMLLSAYLGGAIATHLEHNISIITPVIFQILLFIISVIRFPELLQRLITSTRKTLEKNIINL